MPFELVTVQLGDTATCPDAGPAVGSRVTFFVGNAVKCAAADLREAILGTAGGLLARPIGELDLRDGLVQVRGAAEGGVALAAIARARAGARLANSFDGYFDADVPPYKLSTERGEPHAMYVTGDADGGGRGRRVNRGCPGSCALSRPTMLAGRRSWRVSSGRSRVGSRWAWASP